MCYTCFLSFVLVTQAFWRALNSVFGDKIQFKTTLKGASMLMNSAVRDLWVPGLCFFLLFATMIAGLIELFTGTLLLQPHCKYLSIHVMFSLFQLSAMRVPGLCFFLLFTTKIAGLDELFTGPYVPLKNPFCPRIACL